MHLNIIKTVQNDISTTMILQNTIKIEISLRGLKRQLRALTP